MLPPFVESESFFGFGLCRCEKGAYMFGRDVLCDFSLEHPSVSRFHAGEC